MKYNFFLTVVALTTVPLFLGAAAKPVLGSQPRRIPSHVLGETTAAPTASCSFPSLENNDGLCTCKVNGVTFTTFTPDGGPGNDCHSSTVSIPSSLLHHPTDAPATTATPTPAAGLWCGFPNLEDSDGLCTCTFNNVPFTTYTPDGGPGNDCHSSTVVPPTTKSTATPKPNQEAFEWTVIGDSWSSGVAYSWYTIYRWEDYEWCFRTNEAYGPKMEQEAGSWVEGDQRFNFVACGGTMMADIKRQLGRAGRPQMAVGTFGGNDAGFGDIARACIFMPPGVAGWGKHYELDPDGTGWCKKYLAQAREYIDRPDGLAEDFRLTIGQVYEFSQQEGQQRPRFDLYVSSYVKFFNAETDNCEGWTFARWFSLGYPRLVKALRAEMNELVGKFNDVQRDIINNYKPPASAGIFNTHYVPVSEKYEGHRFCEPNHSFEDQWYSADVWLWNLAWKNGNLAVAGGANSQLGNPDPEADIEAAVITNITAAIGAISGSPHRRRQPEDTEQDEDASMDLRYKDSNGILQMTKPPNAQDGPFPVLPLSTNDRNWLDNQYAPLGPVERDKVDISSQCGFGWMSRPFHPKPLGANAMKDAYIAALRADRVPGVKG